MESKDAIESKERRTVFLGGIPLDATRYELIEYLSHFDKVIRVDIAKDKNTKIFKGYCKAVLETEAGVKRLISYPNHMIRGLHIGIKLWTNKMDYLKSKDEISKRKLFVRHHHHYKAADLYQHFSQFGRVENIDSKTEHFTNKHRNFSYVIFSSEQEALNAIAIANVEEKSNYIYCEFTTPSHLMVIENKTSLCGSPLLNANAKSTKQGTSLSFEKQKFKQKDLGSFAFCDGHPNSSKEIKSATIKRIKPNFDISESQEMQCSSQNAFVSFEIELADKFKRNIKAGLSVDNLVEEFIQLHDTKPTSKGYQILHKEQTYSGSNLVFRKLSCSWRQITNRS